MLEIELISSSLEITLPAKRINSVAKEDKHITTIILFSL